MRQRLWLLTLCLYAAGAAIDIASHVAVEQRAGRNGFAPASLAVAVTAGLFWPIDVVVQVILPR